MVDDVKDILETAENKGSADAVERARIARERREAEQRRRLDELRAHAAAAQAQREKRDEERRRRQEEHKSKDTDRRHQVEERKRAIWEASISRREALLQREKDREERLERARQARSTPRSAFAFGSSTPRLLEPADTSGFFWAARRASSTSNVMYASAPLTRRASALQLDTFDGDNKDEMDRPAPVMWNSVARRRTDLVPTIPASRAPGRAFSMTRLDNIPGQRQHYTSMHHLHRQGRSGDSTPGSRPGSAMSVSTPGTNSAVVRRPHSARKPRPASIAGTGVNTPRGGPDGGASLSTTPSVSRDASSTNMRPATTPRRVRPVSVHLTPSTPTTHRQAVTPGEGKPPIQRKPKLPKEHEKSPRNVVLKARSVSPGRALHTPSPQQSKEASVDKDIVNKKSSLVKDKAQVNATEVTQKLEALQIQHNEHVDDKVKNNKEELVKVNEKVQPVENNTIEEESLVVIDDTNANEQNVQVNNVEKMDDKEEKNDVKAEKIEKTEKKDEKVEKKEDKVEKKDVPEKLEENEMTASMTARRITTEEEAKAALAERRRKAREELEKQAELERQRLEREAERQAQLQKEEEERQRREEVEARELAALQRQMQEEKLRKAIEAQQQLEREEAERKVREEAEKVARLKEDEEKRKAAEEAEKIRKEEAEREEKERIARKQRVEAIMARTRLRKTEEDKKTDNKASAQNAQNSNQTEVTNVAVTGTHSENNGNSDMKNNGNVVNTEDLLGLNQSVEPVQSDEPSKVSPTTEASNGNTHINTPITHLTANFIQNEIAENTQSKDITKLEDADFTTHNGHGNNHSHPLTLQNAI